MSFSGKPATDFSANNINVPNTLVSARLSTNAVYNSKHGTYEPEFTVDEDNIGTAGAGLLGHTTCSYVSNGSLVNVYIPLNFQQVGFGSGYILCTVPILPHGGKFTSESQASGIFPILSNTLQMFYVEAVPGTSLIKIQQRGNNMLSLPSTLYSYASFSYTL